MSRTINGLTVSAMPLNVNDDANGVAARLEVRNPAIPRGAPGHLRYVMQTKPGKGRWAGPVTLLCSCELEQCEHQVAAQAFLALPAAERLA